MGRTSKIELLMLVSEVMVIYRLKILNNGISMEFMECLNKDTKKKCTKGVGPF